MSPSPNGCNLGSAPAWATKQPYPADNASIFFMTTPLLYPRSIANLCDPVPTSCVTAIVLGNDTSTAAASSEVRYIGRTGGCLRLAAPDQIVDAICWLILTHRLQ